ncbi:hypothetical protein A6V39_00450 [Candidatus Mycoplasma haematobovis]|uniref:Uncharacterized protein n=1 Tax=Candidatus Mycoplasma haematobovis TaxID=432608 RepID=A0A1A9QFP6_9MOLU|nr:hypothetical protein [Candidatus Mycoplasma haematobovis]OAL10520.1 hypothetical protein A6V39_00450 [Candidatus Mycoplasma haematobovis]
MSNVVRVAVGLGAISGVAGGGLLLNKFLSTEDIQSKLKANSLEILDSNNNDDIWKKILASYKEVSAKEPKFKFSGEEVSDETKLKKQCEDTLKKKAGEDNESNNYYDKAKRWCTVPTSVEKVLGKERIILSTDTTPTKDKENQAEWDEKIKKYTDQTNKDKIDNLDLGSKAITDVKPENRTRIREACKKLNEKHSFEEGYEEAIKKSQTWCSIEKK